MADTAATTAGHEPVKPASRVKPVPSTRALLRLLPYYHPYRRQVAIGLAATVVAAGLASVIPYLLKRGIDALGTGASSRALLEIGGVMLITAVVSGVLRFTMRQLLNGVSRNIETDLRRGLFARVVALDQSWYMGWRTGDLVARMTNDLNAVRMAAGPAIMYMVNTIAGGLFAMVMMLRISAPLTGLALLPMIGLPVLMIRLGRLIHQRFEAVQSQFSDLSTRAQENLSGVRVVRAYQQEDAEATRFGTLGEQYLDANMSLAKLNGLMNPGFALLAGLGAAITIGVGGQLLIAGRVTVGGYVAFGIYLAMLTWPMIALGWTTNLLQRGAASMTRILELLDAEPLVVQDTGTATLAPTHAGRSIEFRHVSFRYPGTSRLVLDDVSFTVPAGSSLAIVGATGSGKSALMDLIPRFFDPEQGMVLVDGVPVQQVALSALRGEIGYVPQESLLFSETVGENVAYGLSESAAPLRVTGEHPALGLPAIDATAGPTSPSATAASPTSDVEGALAFGASMPGGALSDITEATEIAQLAETVAALPSGFGTRLGERGINLSGGQKQRTALARALARRPRIVLLDDALSAVDTSTEAAILAGLRGALAGRTALIASHRASTVRHADRIIVLEAGRVVESGTHEELMDAGGRYASLLQRQQLLDAIEGSSANAA